LNKITTCVAAVAALLGTSAFAADMAVKAPPSPPPAPVYSWTGWYVGGNVGYSWGDAQPNIAGNGSIGVVATTITTPFSFADSSSTRLDGIVGGGQIGYNFQFSPRWVLGLEADIQGSGERSTIRSREQFAVD
jgi:outer membrane immunogenic protein